MTTGSGDAPADVVVVPTGPGPLVRLDRVRRPRSRDDLDDLIDEVFPESDEGPGWFDAALVVGGAGVVGTTVLGDQPILVAGIGIAAIALGCVLPLRTAWRRAGRRKANRHRRARLARGLSLDVTSPATTRLVAAYEGLLVVAGSDGAGMAAIAAAHGALVEVASLLEGRAPATAPELGYVMKRADAVEALTHSLRHAGIEKRTPTPALDAEALLAAREEVERISGFDSVSRLEELAEDARRGRGPA